MWSDGCQAGVVFAAVVALSHSQVKAVVLVGAMVAGSARADAGKDVVI